MSPLSPFPGPDPWLEPYWAGFHSVLIHHIQDLLNRQLRPLGLVARTEANIYIESFEREMRTVARPDAFVIRRPSNTVTAPIDDASVPAVLDEPIVIRTLDESRKVHYVEILDAVDQERLVTAIEVLSPTNKVDSRGRRQYIGKRDDYRDGGVNLVEIDLIREGDSLADVSLDLIPPEHRTPCGAWVRRAASLQAEVEYYPIPLRRRLPNIRVPLRDSDTDARLPLQSAFDAAYRQGAYDTINYDRVLRPPLNSDDEEWARSRIEAWRESLE